MRIGIDLGGTKIEGIVMDSGSQILARLRVPTPQGDYEGTLVAIAELVAQLEGEVDLEALPVGIAHPGSLSPSTGLLRNANSVCLNGRPLKQDLAQVLGREPRLANDANCMALSETVDGAAAGAANVFAVILGTGTGGGLVMNNRLVAGCNGIGGEWGHNPLPWPRPEWDENPGKPCWCGLRGCIETRLSGPGLAADHREDGGDDISGETIVARAEDGDFHALAALKRYEDRLARALSQVINLLDPDIIVLAGGLSRIQRLYRNVPALWDQWVFSDAIKTRLVPARHGDASGVRGAAWLWPAESFT